MCKNKLESEGDVMIEIIIKWGTDKEETKTYKFDTEEQAKFFMLISIISYIKWFVSVHKLSFLCYVWDIIISHT